MIGIYDLNDASLLDYKRRLEIYKNAGFTSVGLYLDSAYMRNEENYADIIKHARHIGLEVNQVHLDYRGSNLICENSDEYFSYVESKILEGIDLNIKYLVLHASKGNTPPSIDDSHLFRLKGLMNKNSDKITLAFENVRNNDNLNKILSANIKGVSMCFDVGHAYCYSNINKMISSNSNYIVCTHLHNNHGEDSHQLLMDGEINFKEVMDKLKDIKNLDHCLEVFPERGKILSEDEFVSFVKQAYEEYLKVSI